MNPIPEVNSVWSKKDNSGMVVVNEVKKRGRGYYVVTSEGRYRLKDFNKLELVLVGTGE